ncbi:helix-turn-helix domain-containing protein [Microvirga sp. P5_D2]
MTEKNAFSISELAKAGPLGRSKLYEAIRDGALVARKAGRRTIILKADFERFLASLPLATFDRSNGHTA